MEMVVWQRAEGAIVFLAAGALFFLQGGSFVWWMILAVFFAPDISFAAYWFGPRIGSVCYNLAHIYALGVVMLALGAAFESQTFAQFGALWLAHSGFDRLLGYGLKSRSGFRLTHLGLIGAKHDTVQPGLGNPD